MGTIINWSAAAEAHGSPQRKALASTPVLRPGRRVAERLGHGSSATFGGTQEDFVKLCVIVPRSEILSVACVCTG